MLACQTNPLNLLRFYFHVIFMEEWGSPSGQSFSCVTIYIASSVGNTL